MNICEEQAVKNWCDEDVFMCVALTSFQNGSKLHCSNYRRVLCLETTLPIEQLIVELEYNNFITDV